MLPSGKFPRIVLAVAGLLAAAEIGVIGFVRVPATSLLLSNFLDFAVISWATICVSVVARRSAAYLRQLWLLLGAALFLESVAQGLTTYYQSFARASRLSPEPPDILFFLWVVPTVMMFLPRSEETSGGIVWERVLDFCQLGIVALTAYLYFFYVPSRWESEGPRMLSLILQVYLVRDSVLCAGFLICALTVSAPVFRKFFAMMTLLFFGAGVSDLLYMPTAQMPIPSATWGDFAWCLPYLFVSAFAAGWRFEAEPPYPETRSRFGVLVVSQVLPVGIPLLVLLLGRQIAQEQASLVWIAVTASFLCSAARLIVTSEKQRRSAEALRRVEKALRQTEEMFSTAFRSSPDAISIGQLPDARYVEINESFTRMTGYSREEALGKNAVDLQIWVDPAQRAEILQRLAAQGQVQGEEFLIRTKAGEVRAGELSAAQIQLGGKPGVLGIVRDITDYKQAEEALRSSEERFRTIVQTLQSGLVLMGPRGEVRFANPAALETFGVTLEQVLGKTGNEVGLLIVGADGKDLPFSERIVPQVLATGRGVRNVLCGLRRPDLKRTLWGLVNATPQFTKDGEIGGVIVSFTEITERMQAEEALRQLSSRLLQLQDEERRRLGRDLHDSLAQRVLAVNLNLAQVTQSGSPLEERSRRALSEAREMLQEMSREIRTLSYLLHPPLLDELGLVSAVKEYAEGFGQRSGIELEVDLPAAFGRLPQEAETALFRIVQESLTNIQRHSGSPTARISLHADSSGVTLEVSDRGHGMLQSVLEHGNGAEARFGVGILGMRERMKQLGGRLDINSSEAGTRVRATLPKAV